MKNSMVRTIAATLAVASLTAFGAIAYAQPAQSQDQTQYQVMHDEFMKKTDPIYQDLYVKQNELDALKLQEKPDVAAIKKVSQEIAGLSSKLRTERMDLHNKMREKGIQGRHGIDCPQGRYEGGMMHGGGHKGGMHKRGAGRDCPNYDQPGKNTQGHRHWHGERQSR